MVVVPFFLSQECFAVEYILGPGAAEDKCPGKPANRKLTRHLFPRATALKNEATTCKKASHFYDTCPFSTFSAETSALRNSLKPKGKRGFALCPKSDRAEA